MPDAGRFTNANADRLAAIGAPAAVTNTGGNRGKRWGKRWIGPKPHSPAAQSLGSAPPAADGRGVLGAAALAAFCVDDNWLTLE
jgi:hypothetical protein